MKKYELLYLNIKKLMFFVILTMSIIYLLRWTIFGVDIALNSLPLSFCVQVIIWTAALSLGFWGGWIKEKDLKEKNPD